MSDIVQAENRRLKEELAARATRLNMVQVIMTILLDRLQELMKQRDATEAKLLTATSGQSEADARCMAAEKETAMLRDELGAALGTEAALRRQLSLERDDVSAAGGRGGTEGAATSVPPPPGSAPKGGDVAREGASGTVANATEPALHPLHPGLLDAIGIIASNYDPVDFPPAITHLQALIDAREYGRVRGEITTIWSDLLKFHQKRGLRIHHQVTTTFNTVNTLVKRL